MRLGVYGGSFDPPHRAHVGAADLLVREGLVDRVLVVPVYEHPFSKDLLEFDERLELCRLAFAGLSGVVVSDVERHLPRPNFMLNTLQAVKGLHPEAELRLVVGADVLADLPRWHRVDEVLALAPLLALGRVGFEEAGVTELALPDIASSRLRSELRTERNSTSPPANLLPPAVWARILERGLYR